MQTLEKSLITLEDSGKFKTITFDVSFIKDNYDIPYLSMKNLTDFFVKFAGESYYTVEMSTKGQTAVVTRNGTKASMNIDFNKDEISITGKDVFIATPGIKETALDLVATASKEIDQTKVLLRESYHSAYIGSEVLDINLKDYDIDLIWSNNEGYIPFQIFNDLVFTSMLLPVLYNGSEFYALPGEFFKTEQVQSTFFKKQKTMRSESLAKFNYNALCLNLDLHYGIKEEHQITSGFDNYFQRIGLKESLLSLDPDVSTQALTTFLSYYINDGHSDFTSWTAYTPVPNISPKFGSFSFETIKRREEIMNMMGDHEVNPLFPNYTEVGDTAFILFNAFTVATPNYYADGLAPSSTNLWWQQTNDTIGLIQHAHHMITREASPVKNVVIDLTFNGGGAIDAAAYVVSWVTGEKHTINETTDLVPGYISYLETSTHAALTQSYLCDVNLDHKFDEKDMLSTYNKKVFCLTSDYSFSCANFVPSIFKETRKATLIGKKTGGGTCAVFNTSTADGSLFRISGPYQLSAFQNGSYYSIDRGIEPDIYVDDLNVLYAAKGETHRGQLIDLIHSIK